MATRIFNKVILPSKLHQELEAVINGLLIGIQYAPETNTVTVNLTGEPNGTEDQAITDAVNNHTPSWLSYKIWDYVVDPPVGHHPPIDLDYKKGLSVRLHDKKTYVKGEMTLKEYYEGASADPVTGEISYTNLILKEENVYTRDVAGFAVVRQQTITWVREDESYGPHQKITLKYYSGIDKIQEGKTRRGNLMDSLMMDVANMMLANATVAKGSALDPAEIETELQRGRDMLTEYEDGFAAFISHSDKGVLTSVTNDVNHSFLNDNVPGSNPVITIRDYVVNEMTI
jgi:hypothetical protein